jgi:hypothetical protein
MSMRERIRVHRQRGRRAPTRLERGREEEPKTLPGEGSRDFLLDEAIPGTVVGLIGGTLMMLFYMAGSSVFGHGPWDGPKMISGIFRTRLELSDLGPADVLLGLVLHFGVACTLAVTFAMMVPRHGVMMFAIAPMALLFSMVAYAMLVPVVADTIDPLFRDNVHRFLWFVSNLIFGASLLLIVPMRSRSWVHHRLVPSVVRREARARAA